MQQIDTPVYWEIGIDSHFWNGTDVLTIPFYIELPEMSFADLMNGCALHVNRGGGIKTRWKGLQPEMIENWNVPDGYDLIKSQVYMKAQARFKNIKMMYEHNYMLKQRDFGNLLGVLAA